MSYAILHIPRSEVENKYGIAESFCNLAIGDHDLTRFHLSNDMDYIQECLTYYKNKWPKETYRIMHVEEI